jgi:hypothetical protein
MPPASRTSRKAGCLAVALACLMLTLPASAAAVPYYEVIAPSGNSRGIVVFFHGGGWRSGSEYVVSAREAAGIYAEHGFTVWNVDYASGPGSVTDAINWYRLAQSVSGGQPVCVAGESSGGHLALMVAGAEPSVSCVIAEAAPTDLEHLPEPGRSGAAQIFGEGNLAAMSPVSHPSTSPSTRILLVSADHDPIVPPGQAAAYKAVRPDRTYILTMPPGNDAWWVHVSTSSAGWLQLWIAKRDLLDQVVRDAGSEPPDPSDPDPYDPTDPADPLDPTLPGGGDVRNVLQVGSPTIDRRKGVAWIPVTLGERGRLGLAGPGVRTRFKEVDAGQRSTMKVRPLPRLERRLVEEGRARVQVKLELTGAKSEAFEFVSLRLVRR